MTGLHDWLCLFLHPAPALAPRVYELPLVVWRW